MGLDQTGFGLDWVAAKYKSYCALHAERNSLPTYSELTSECQRVIDFTLPTTMELFVSRKMSTQLERGIALQLPTRHMGFHASWESKNLLALGRLWVDNGTLQVLYIQKLKQPWILAAAAEIMRPPLLGSQLRIVTSRRSPTSSLAWGYASNGNIFGCRYLYALTDRSSIGGEIYYTAIENSGGLSLGARFIIMKDKSSFPIESNSIFTSTVPTVDDNHEAPCKEGKDQFNYCEHPKGLIPPMVGTFLVNPIMGHVQVTLASPICLRSLTAAIRYDLNVYSFDTDLTCGLTCIPSFGQQLRLRASWRHGLAIGLSSTLHDRVCMNVGIASGPFWKKSSDTESVPITPWKSLNPSVGLELCIES